MLVIEIHQFEPIFVKMQLLTVFTAAFALQLLPLEFRAQSTTTFVRTDTVPVVANSQQLPMAWAGGLNFVQLSEIDLDMDGTQDLFVFDRTGNKVTTYLNNGTPGQVDYELAPQYVSKFPPMHDWVLLRDYNCDGKADIFTYSVAGFAVYKNISTTQSGLQFQLMIFLVNTNRSPNSSNFIGNLFVSQIDIPVIRDLDGDGDLDVLTFGNSGTQIEYHKNMGMETYGTCDSISYVYTDQCFGDFAENALNANISLNVSCGPVPVAPDANTYFQRNTMHAGSCMECFNTDGDNDWDLLIGDITNPAMTYLRNSISLPGSLMDSVNYQYPANSFPVALNIFPCPFHLDVNNDGKKDLIFSPNASNTSENYRSLWLYNNTGQNDSVIVNFVQNNFLQDQMIDLGEGAFPVFFDYDNDGDQDLLVGNYGYYNSAGIYPSKIALFRNNGTATNPFYVLIDDDFANLYANNLGLICMYPTFGDLDGDGDKDMLIGDVNGKLHYFRKDPGPADNFTLVQGNYQGIDVGNFAAPQLVDVDRDGKLDLLIGEQNGNINYYRNTATSASPTFSLITPLFGNVIVNQAGYTTGYSIPCLFNDNGVYSMLVGSERGYVYRFDNIDNNLSGNFTLTDSLYISHVEGGRVAPTIADITGDNYYDVVIGNYSGGMSLFMGDAGVNVPEIGNGLSSLYVYPNPSSDFITIAYNDLSSRRQQLDIFTITGALVHSEILWNSGAQVNVKALPAGVYVVALTSENGIKQTTRVVVTQSGN